MQTEIIREKKWFVVGMSFYGDPFTQAAGWSEDNEIGLLWKRFSAFADQRGDEIAHQVHPGTLLEIHIETDHTKEQGLFEVFVGAQVARLDSVPLVCSVKVLPATEYALCTLQGSEITSDWGKLIYQDWLPSSGYRPAHAYMIQSYDARFRGLDCIDESVLDVYIPVEKAG